MDDIGGEVGGAIHGIAKHVGGTMVGEVKKLGKTALTHVTGTKTDTDSQADKKAHIHSHFSPLGELQRFGQTFTSQITGKPMTAREISAMAARDKYLSQQDWDAVHQRVLQIYREYEEKRKKEREDQAKVHIQLEEQKKQSTEALRLKAHTRSQPDSAIAKTRAEIGKNWGAE